MKEIDDASAKEVMCPKKHRFHEVCIDNWRVINTKCPLCGYNIK